MTQPFFIGGIDDVEVAKASAFGAAGMFLFTFVASIVYLIHDAQQLNRVGGNRERTALPNPFAAQRGSLFHDYDPVDTDTPEAGVFT